MDMHAEYQALCDRDATTLERWERARKIELKIALGKSIPARVEAQKQVRSTQRGQAKMQDLLNEILNTLEQLDGKPDPVMRKLINSTYKNGRRV